MSDAPVDDRRSVDPEIVDDTNGSDGEEFDSFHDDPGSTGCVTVGDLDSTVRVWMANEWPDDVSNPGSVVPRGSGMYEIPVTDASVKRVVQLPVSATDVNDDTEIEMSETVTVDAYAETYNSLFHEWSGEEYEKEIREVIIDTHTDDGDGDAGVESIKFDDLDGGCAEQPSPSKTDPSDQFEGLDGHLIETRITPIEKYNVTTVSSMYVTDDENGERVDVTCRHERAGEMRVHSVERVDNNPAIWESSDDDAPAVVDDVAKRIQMLDRGIRGDATDMPSIPDRDRDVDLDMSAPNGDSIDGEAVRYGWMHEEMAWEDVTPPSMNKDEGIEDLARELDNVGHWMSIDERNAESHVDLWFWTDDEGWIENAATRVLKPFLTSYAPDHIDSNIVKKVAYQLSGKNTIREKILNSGPSDDGVYVPVKNCVLNLTNVDYDFDLMSIDPSTVDVIDHQPEHHWTYRIDTAWDPETADVDGVDEWLGELFARDVDARVFWEFTGHAMVPEYPSHGFAVLLGEGQGGKSKLLRSVRETIGTDNVAAQSLKSIEENRFGMQPVYDKLLNIDDDVSGTKLASTSTLKKLSAGGRITVDVKMEPLIETYNQATLMLASQNPLALPQRDRAIGRRLYPLEVVAHYVDDPSGPHEYQREPERQVIERVTGEEYRRAVLIRGVEGLVRLREEGDFTAESGWEERIQRYETWADPIADFARVALVQVEGSTFMEDDSVEDVAVSAKDMKRAYDVYAQQNNQPGKSIQQLSTVLEDLPYLSFSKHRDRSWSSRDGKDTYYRGIRFSTHAKHELLGDWADWERYLTPGSDSTTDTVEKVVKSVQDDLGEERVAVEAVVDALADEEGVGRESAQDMVSNAHDAESPVIVTSGDDVVVAGSAVAMNERRLAVIDTIRSSSDDVGVDDVIESLDASADKIKHDLKKLIEAGTVYEPETGVLRAT